MLPYDVAYAPQSPTFTDVPGVRLGVPATCEAWSCWASR
jgi:hypothetical protein